MYKNNVSVRDASSALLKVNDTVPQGTVYLVAVNVTGTLPEDSLSMEDTVGNVYTKIAENHHPTEDQIVAMFYCKLNQELIATDKFITHDCRWYYCNAHEGDLLKYSCLVMLFMYIQLKEHQQQVKMLLFLVLILVATEGITTQLPAC